MPPLTIVCVLWVGDFERCARQYHLGWVKRLRERVPARFPMVCLTNVGKPDRDYAGDVEFAALRNDWPGWWGKLEVFDHPALSGRCLFLDLDTGVLGDLAPFETFECDLGLIPRTSTWVRGGRSWGGSHYKTPAMLYTAGKFSADFSMSQVVYSKARGSLYVEGDQGWVNRNAKRFGDVRAFPGQWFIRHKRYAKMSDDERARELTETQIAVADKDLDKRYR